MTHRLVAVDDTDYRLPEPVFAVVQDSIQASTGLNVLDYGVIGDGLADDTGALQAAADAAGTFGMRLIIPPRAYKTTATVNVSSGVEAFDAQIRYHGTGTAIKVGKDVASISGKTFTLPHVIHVPAQWNDGSVGIDVVNIYSSNFTFNRVEKFDVGVQFRGLGRGCVYNQAVLGYLLDNRINLLLTQDETGWANENVFFGGRFHHVETGSLGVSGSTDTHHIALLRGSTTLGGPNNNVFVKPSLEGNSVNSVRVVIDDARYNTFFAARWETGGAIAGKIKYVGGAAFNRLIGGYDLRFIQEDFSEISAGATGGTIQDGQGSRILLRSNAAQSIPNATDTTMLWGAPAGNTLLRVTYQDGVFTPRPGEWNVQVQVAFDANATGVRTARIKSVSGTVLAQTQVIPSGGARAYLYLSTRLSEPFYVEVNQSSGGALLTSSGSGNCTIMAEPVAV